MSKPVATITIEFEHDGQPMKAVYECASIPEVALDSGHRDYLNSFDDPPEVKDCRWITRCGTIRIAAMLPSRDNFADIEERIRQIRAKDSK